MSTSAQSSGARPPGSIALLDGAFDLLRAAPASAWLVWAMGCLPFGLGVIAFVGEMTGSANAGELLPAHALALALLFLWMTANQARFARRLRPLLDGAAPTQPAIASQIVVGGTSVLMLPLAALSILGFPWMAAFYYSASASDAPDTGGIYRYGSRQASTWSFSMVNDFLITLLLGLVVFLNVFVLLASGPALFRTLTGQESVFTRDPSGMMNGTLFTAAVVITWLLLDPLLRAMFVIRCFRVDAIRTGVDLRAAIRRGAGVLMLLLTLFALPVKAAQPSKTPQQSVDPPRLDRSIREVTHRPEFLWQEPRAVETSAPANAFVRFTQDAVRFIGNIVHEVFDWLGAVIQAILRWLLGHQQEMPPDDAGRRGLPYAAPILYVLMALAAGAVVFLFLRIRRERRKAQLVPTVAAPELLDLASEHVAPDQAPEDEWLATAARLLDAGNLRLAMRALYLAVLASLGEAGLITIHRARSNLDYQREVARRARGNVRLLQTFRGLVAAFERTWYGDHAMSREDFDGFRRSAQDAAASSLKTRDRTPAASVVRGSTESALEMRTRGGT